MTEIKIQIVEMESKHPWEIGVDGTLLINQKMIGAIEDVYEQVLDDHYHQLACPTTMAATFDHTHAVHE